jgi:hypothetical protein
VRRIRPLDRRKGWRGRRRIATGNIAGGIYNSGAPKNLDGNERIVYGTVDVAAYEWHFPGDANGDRTVDLTDFTILAANFNEAGRSTERQLLAFRNSAMERASAPVRLARSRMWCTMRSHCASL